MGTGMGLFMQEPRDGKWGFHSCRELREKVVGMDMDA
jgi:hypothetical protein